MTTQANSTDRGRQRGRQRPATSSPPSQPGPNPRKLAASILGTIGRTQGFSNRILDHELSRVPGLSTRDRGLTTSLVYGVLRHRGRLDAVIDHFAQKPRGLKGQVRTALRIGAFELLELGHPLHAVASEVAKLLRKVGNGKMLRP
ncbi:MAG: transcription antitermination factor NusB, partial [Nannocystaceae bacterium]